MKICNSNFIGNNQFLSNIVDLLCNDNSVFSDSSKSTIISRYSEMVRNTQYCNTWNGFEKEYVISNMGIQLSSNFNGLQISENLGHDLPIWFDPSDVTNEELTVLDYELEDLFASINFSEKFQNKKVMLVGIDPLRQNRAAGNIYLSAPWGMHSSVYRSGGKICNGKQTCSGAQSKTIYQVIRFLVSQGASVYLTDARKLYAKDISLVKYDGIFGNILQDEINLVNPDFIIEIGNNPIHPQNIQGVFPHPNSLRLKDDAKRLIYLYNLSKI